MAGEDIQSLIKSHLDRLDDGERAAFVDELVQMSGEETLALMDRRAEAGEEMDEGTHTAIGGLVKTVQQRAVWVASREVSRRS